MTTCRESGVLIAHGDATSGYALYVRDGHLHHVLNVGGERVRVSSSHPIGPGDHLLSVQVRRAPPGEPPRPGLARPVGRARFTLTIDGQACGEAETTLGFATLISWSGLDIGRDRGSPVDDYQAPFVFQGGLRKVVFEAGEQAPLDGDLLGRAEMARQ